MMRLPWPDELAGAGMVPLPRHTSLSSLRFDLHGDPSRAQLAVCSDGNHHMALSDALQAFADEHPAVGEIFYSTTPPRIAAEIVRGGGLQVGNLRLTVTPHVFIGPPSVVSALAREGRVTHQAPFMAGRGLALLVRKGNPKRIGGVADLRRDDVRVFLSNPDTESVSHRIYVEGLQRCAADAGVVLAFLECAGPSTSGDALKVCFGEVIHHREAPERVADASADVAVVFHHLALRYARIFPAVFEFLPLRLSNGSECDAGVTQCALLSSGGRWGQLLFDFLRSEHVGRIYAHHGLMRMT